jgi:hypothetical protein
MTETPEDKDMDEAKRIMERLVKMPPKPHDSGKKDKSQDKNEAPD